MLRQCVYANPASPYLPLLRRAGCAYEDIADGVRRAGLEKFLARLKTAGVWVSFDEFKSAQQDFNNYALSATCEVSSGGSSGQTARSHLDLDCLEFRSYYDHFFFKMLDLYRVPLGLWYPKLPAVTGVGNCLRYAKLGKPVDRWFSLIATNQVKSGRELSYATDLMVWASRLSRHPLPTPELLEMDKFNTALDWILQQREKTGRCAFQRYLSQVIRIAQAAKARETDLSSVVFIVGAEPLTENRHREIEAVGARVSSRYFASEIGTIALECGCPSEIGDYHVATPSVAVVTDGPSLLFTSLLRSTPKVLINVQLGDSGSLEDRDCGCLTGELGLRTHVRQVGSFRRAKSEGMTVPYRDLARLIEEALLPRFGGSSLDYQWVEREDARGLTRLCLRVHPDRGAISETEMAETILAWLRRGGAGLPLAAELWRKADTIQIVRERPQQTALGKTVAVVRNETKTEH